MIFAAPIKANRNWKAIVLCATWSLLLIQGSVQPVLGQVVSDASQPIPHNKARAAVHSDPPGQIILLDGRRLDTITPAELDLSPGHYYMILTVWTCCERSAPGDINLDGVINLKDFLIIASRWLQIVGCSGCP